MFLWKKRGSTLIEIVISVLILACAFLPILRLVDYGSNSTAKIGHYAKATRLAQDLIEECKHVPFKVYQQKYSSFGSGKSINIDPEFYKDTKKSIDEFINEAKTKDKVKDFACKATLKTKKNDLDQIIEIWFQVEISWYDLGKISDAHGDKRTIKVGNCYYNSEAL